ncbi:MAG: FlgB family protein [Pseudomonadota bacterium]
MFEDLSVLRLAAGLAQHATARQSVIAENIANADTPNYIARDIVSFADMVAGRPGSAGEIGATALAPGTTRPGHFAMTARGGAFAAVEEDPAPGSISPNGNGVSLEDQMMRSAEVRMQHDLALGIYSKTLALMRLGLGRPR